MEFGQLMADILAYVSCKFEMYIFEIAQVIGENVPIAYFYVLSIHYVNIAVPWSQSYNDSLKLSRP